MSGASSPEAIAEDRAPRHGMLKERLIARPCAVPLCAMEHAILMFDS
jgi:hypothetical protein